jgi:raffinose/stachyose/melibiose transport system substrate-binding protein
VRQRAARYALRLLTMLLALGTVSLTRAAPDAEAARQVITMWFWGAAPINRQALQQALVDPFNRSQSRYQLVIEYRTSVDYDVRIAAIANRGPDIVYTSGPSDVQPLARAGKLEPMDRYAAQYGWEQRLLAPVLNTCRQFGHLYCVPPSVCVNGMFYNKAVLRSNGWSVPKTREQVEAIMRAAQARGLYASVTGNGGWEPVNEDYISVFLNQVAGPFVLRDVLSGRAAWTSAPMQSAMTELDRWYRAGFLGGGDYFLLNFDSSLALLHQGRSPFFFAPSFAFQWATNYFQGADADDLGFAPFPNMNPALPYPIYDPGSAFTLSINAHSRVKDGAAEVLNWILSSRFVLDISRAWPGYWSIPLKSFPQDPAATGLIRTYYESMADITHAVQSGAFGYNVDAYLPDATKELLGQDLEAVWLDQERPDQMLQRAARVYARERARGALLDDIPTPHF